MNHYFEAILSRTDNISTLKQLCYHIIMVIRERTLLNANYDINHSNVIIQTLHGKILKSIPESEFLLKGEDFLKKTSGVNNVSINVIEFLNKIECNNISEINANNDLIIILHDERCYQECQNRRSIIESYDEDAIFIYKINNIRKQETVFFNSLQRCEEKFAYMQSIGAELSFYKLENNILHNNFILLDAYIERIVAEVLLNCYFNKENDFSEIIEIIENSDPLKIKANTQQLIYTYKIKQLLFALALGMKTTSVWYGRYANCFVFINKNSDIKFFTSLNNGALGDYLFYNTRFETPSTSRHEFGEIYKDGDDFFLKLNLQIRFK